MNRWTYILLLPIVACGSTEERAAERALHEGAKPYRSEQYAEAASVYATATKDPLVEYNLGNALYRSDLLDSSIVAFSEVTSRSNVPEDQAMAYHNLGNAWSRLADQADTTSQHLDDRLKGIKIEGDDIATKVRQVVLRDSMAIALRASEQLIDSALAQGAEAFKNVLRRTPMDEDSRYNLALVQRRIAARVQEEAEKQKNNNDQNKDKGLSEKAILLMKQADELVDQFKFTEALDVLRAGLKAEPTLQQRQDYMNKLDVVTKAAEAQ